MALATFVMKQKVDGGAAVDISRNPKFQAANKTGTYTADPINAPLAGDPAVRSYEVWLLLECTAAPDNQVENFAVYGPSTRPDAAGAGAMAIYIGTTPTFSTPTDSSSSVATARADTNHYSPGTALSIDVTPGDAVIDAVGETTDYIVHQLEVAEGVSLGNMTTQSFIVTYEES